MTFPDDDAEFGRCWSSAAGKLAGLKEAKAEAERRSAEAFIRRRDDVANALRDLAVHLDHLTKEAAAVLDKFIAEDRDRRRRIARLQH